MEEFEAIVTKPEAAEERKAIEADLNSMQVYFDALIKAEQKLDEAL